jgi:hypothetical protein
MRLWTLIFTSSILAECRRWSWITFVDGPGCWPRFCIGVWRGLRWCGLQQRHQAHDHSVLEDSGHGMQGSCACCRNKVLDAIQSKELLPATTKRENEETVFYGKKQKNAEYFLTLWWSRSLQASLLFMGSGTNHVVVITNSQPSGLPSLFAPSTENLHSPLFVPSREQSADNVLRDKTWNEMRSEGKWIDWLMRGVDPSIYTQGKGV